LPAIAEYIQLWETLQGFELSDLLDRTVWWWTPDGMYTEKSAYCMLHSGAIKFKRMHWTADRRAGHGLETRENCYLCDQAPEAIDHLIATCPYTKEVWFFVCQAQRLPQPAQTVIAWWRSLRSPWSGDQRAGIDSLFSPWSPGKSRKRTTLAASSEMNQLRLSIS